jgi:RNA recognition motif-containing protein
VIPKEVTEKPTQKAIEITQVEAERETSPQQNNGNRGGLLDPNVSKMGKMFIGGLSWETTDEGLRNYMQIYGEIEDVLIMKDSLTNRSRGFAFLTFKNPASIDKVLQTEHYIDGKKVRLWLNSKCLAFVCLNKRLILNELFQKKNTRELKRYLWVVCILMSLKKNLKSIFKSLALLQKLL